MERKELIKAIDEMIIEQILDKKITSNTKLLFEVREKSNSDIMEEIIKNGYPRYKEQEDGRIAFEKCIREHREKEQKRWAEESEKRRKTKKAILKIIALLIIVLLMFIVCKNLFL